MELFEQLKRKNAEMLTEQLAAAKAEAEETGKEPFDLAKLKTLVDTSDQGTLHTDEERQQRFEKMYYLQRPDVKTMTELAEHVKVLNQW